MNWGGNLTLIEVVFTPTSNFFHCLSHFQKTAYSIAVVAVTKENSVTIVHSNTIVITIVNV